ncbi:ead/Ea22-like family protein [Salmonella enterica subsp. diarizonae]|nr:ead/Ea22-like family protein [Salmonella enterica subsp. diarizonae]
MSNIDKQALLSTDKHANQHRLSRLTMEVHSDELRIMASAVENYTDELIAALEAAEKHIAELESKNGYLRTIAHEQNELAIRASLDSNNATVELGRLHKRIAELEAKLETADKLQDSAFRDGLKAGFSYGQTDDQSGFAQCMSAYSPLAGVGVKQQEDSVDSDVGSRNQPGMVVAVHIDAGDFVKVKGQVFEVEETDFDDHDVTLWFVGGNALKCSAGCPVEVVSEPVAAGIKVKES